MAGMAGPTRERERGNEREGEKMKPRDRANVAVAWPAKRRVCRRDDHRDIYTVGLFISWHIGAHFDENAGELHSANISNDATTLLG